MLRKKKYYKGKTLIAPSSYWKLTIKKRNKMCNGCGPQGWKGSLVPDTMYGKKVSDACNIHDYMYELGGFEKDKKIADKTFYENLKIIVDGPWWNPLTYTRKMRAWTYYMSVKMSGKEFFKYNKDAV